MKNPSHLLTKKEAAAELRLCIRSVELLLSSRALSHLKIGKSVRISRDALDAFKAAHTVEAVR